MVTATRVEKFTYKELHDSLSLYGVEAWSPELIANTVHHLAMYLDTFNKAAFDASVKGAKRRYKKIGVPIVSATCQMRYITGTGSMSVMCAARLSNLDNWTSKTRGLHEDLNSIANISAMVERLQNFTRKKAVWFENGFAMYDIFYLLDTTRTHLTEVKIDDLLTQDLHAFKQVGIINPRTNRVYTINLLELS